MYILWCLIKMRVFHQNEISLTCPHPPMSYGGRKERAKRQLSFLWKTHFDRTLRYRLKLRFWYLLPNSYAKCAVCLVFHAIAHLTENRALVKNIWPLQEFSCSQIFHFLPRFQNGLLEEDDLDAFFNKIIKYLGVEPNSKRYFRFQDVKNSFWECIKDQLVREYKGMHEISNNLWK